MGEITGMEDVVTAGGEAADGAGKAAIPVGPVNSVGPVEPADLANSVGPVGPAVLAGPMGPAVLVGPADPIGPAGLADSADLVAPVRVDRDRREGPADDEGAWWRYLTLPICEAGGSSPAS